MIFKRSAYDWLVVGLGNPGIQYENTRHNVGFMTADLFIEENGGTFNKHKFEALCGECKIGGSRILTIKPETYMNNSGRAVSAAASYYKIPSERIIVISDDVTLDVGKIRIRRKGSHGGHNGLKDIFELLGTDDIKRIKIGVGKKPCADYDLAAWVLSKFPAESCEELDKAIKTAVMAVKAIISRDIDFAMNKYNN